MAAERVQRPVREVVREPGTDQRAHDPVVVRDNAGRDGPARAQQPGRPRVTQHHFPRREEPLPQPRTPVSVRFGRVEAADRVMHLSDHGLDDAVEQGLLARQMVVERHGLDADVSGEAAHRQRLDPLRIRQDDRRRQHALAAERLAECLRCHRSSTPLSVPYIVSYLTR
nr:hypothetical protein [Nonomuraea aurantiaca]